MGAPYVADLLDALGRHEAARGLRWFDRPEDRTRDEIEAALGRAEERVDELAQGMCGRCRRKTGVLKGSA